MYPGDMTRRGRPPGIDSAETRQRIIDVARREFASRGYAASAITAVASKAELAPSAIYHYFGGKAELYEAVFEDTAERIWTQLGADVVTDRTFLEATDHLLEASTDFGADRRHFNDFLAMVPMESRLHPEFAHLLDRRSKYQDDLFGAIADLGLSTGELTGVDRSTALEMIRSAIMGSFFERHFRPELREDSVRAAKELFRRMVG